MIHGFHADFIGSGTVKGDIKQSRGIYKVILGIVKFYAGHTFYLREFILQGKSFVIGNVRYHYFCSSIGDKFLIHNGKTAPGFRFCRQVSSDVIFHLNPFC